MWIQILNALQMKSEITHLRKIEWMIIYCKMEGTVFVFLRIRDIFIGVIVEKEDVFCQ